MATRPAQRNSSDVQLAVIQTDVQYIKEEIRNMHNDITTGYAPLSKLTALEDKVALIYRALAFLLAIIVLAIFAAISKVIFK